jgi:hypothetical protein
MRPTHPAARGWQQGAPPWPAAIPRTAATTTLAELAADGGWRMADGGWRMADGGWRMADGGWRMADDGWRMADDGQVFYQSEHDEDYIVWYGMSLGESWIYHSDSKRWTRGG